MIPSEITREHILQALAEIVAKGVPRHRASTRFEILHEGRRYPPKYVVSLAARYTIGQEFDPSRFNGGKETNSFLDSRGFTVVPKQEVSIRELLEIILQEYIISSGNEAFGKDNDIWQLFSKLEEAFTKTQPIQDYPEVTVKWSIGQGNWGKVPWLAFLDSRETRSPKEGVYCVLLFRQDMTGVYLTLNQGVTNLYETVGAQKARQTLNDTAEQIRQQVGHLEAAGYNLNNDIDLRSDLGLATRYVESTIAHKLYEANQVPDDEVIGQDMRALLSAYRLYVVHGKGTMGQSWIFQASPQYYDIMGAMRTLPTQTWLVSQHRAAIHKDDRVFVWESGPNAGIVGAATIETEPEEMPIGASEKSFIRDEKKFAGLQPRVLLRINKVLESRLTREEMKKDEILGNLAIIANPRGTNFRLTAEQNHRLEELLGLGTSLFRWRRQESGSYNLVLENPERVDQEKLESLFERFLKTSNQMQPEFNQYLKEDMRRWIGNPKEVLPSEAFVTLSNWFLTSIGGLRDAERGRVAGEVWDCLFLCRPEERLSSPESGKNHIVLSDRFEAWWAKMQKLQQPGQERKAMDDGRFVEICQRTFLPREFFEDLVRLLGSKQQVILQGVPGTGKTFVAEEFARWWSGNPEFVRTIQFHESYGYEDFVEGYKPQENTARKETTFVLTRGPFMTFCDLARNNPKERFTLVIDEINRAKTARVFGELLYLLEYREKAITLQSGKSFSIPDNLYILGTMNTVDKSIALVDYALRRRFAFVTLLPVKDGRSVVLRPWLEANNVANAEEVERLFVALNKIVSSKDEALLVGHSHFMSKESGSQKRISKEQLDFIWRYYILPLVSEYEYDLSAQQIEEKYGLEAIRRATQSD